MEIKAAARRVRMSACALLFAGACSVLNASAQSGAMEPYQEYSKRLRAAQQVDALTGDLFGENVSLFNGQTSFTATDIDLAGNNKLPVQLVRRLPIVAQPANTFVDTFAGVGNWDIDVPYIAGTFDSVYKWSKNSIGEDKPRCSEYFYPSTSSQFKIRDIFSGYDIHIPNVDDTSLLARIDDTLPFPSGTTNPKWTTRNLDAFACTATANGYPGEGFVMRASDGMKYTFNVGVERNVGAMKNDVVRRSRLRIYLLASKVEDRFGNRVDYTYNAEGYPTRIASSDGRVITMTYLGGRLDTATADGRVWSYDYTSGGQLGTVTTPELKTWQFSYTGSMRLVYETWDAQMGPGCANVPPVTQADFGITITHPSGASGQFAFRHARHYRSGVRVSNCVLDDPGGFGKPLTYWLAVPNFFDVFSIASKTISGAAIPTPMQWSYAYGSGAHAYWGTQVPSASICMNRAQCPLSKLVLVTNPDGTKLRYSFGVLFGLNEGKLLDTTTIAASGQPLRREINEYVTEAEAPQLPFPNLYGSAWGSDEPSATRIRPIKRRVVLQSGAIVLTEPDPSTPIPPVDPPAPPQPPEPDPNEPPCPTDSCDPWIVTPGDEEDSTEASPASSPPTPVDPAQSFVSEVLEFDPLGRAIKVRKSSSLGYSKDETTTYADNLSLWVLGQPRKLSVGGVTVSETTFDTLARPSTIYEFSKLASAMTYYTGADPKQFGTLASVKDGNAKVTLLSGWKRGTPQMIVHPVAPGTPAEIETAVVNDDGTIASVKDEAGFTTGYAYDAMGRLSQVNYPTGDSVAWNATTLSFARSAISRYGLPAGYWLRLVDTGKGRKAIHYDALWRPVVEESFDNTSQATIDATQSVVVKRYDAADRLEFQSYPVRSLTDWTDTTLKGTHTTYDALDRPLLVKQDSELGVLTTKTEYLSGFTTRTTNPRGQQTLTTYQAWDEPTFDYPMAITHPEGAFTAFSRDAFGKPTSIVRRNADSTIKATRSYLYGGAERLCMMTEPETGSTVVWYDEVGNLVTSVAGLTIPAGTSCPDAKALAAASGRLVSRTYDARNRLETLVFPDHRGDTSQTYTPDGKLASITVDNGGTDQVTTSYAYNRRRLPTQEVLSWANGNISWQVAYTYDKNGTLSAQAWHGLNVAYAPNALGQPTQAGAYAQDVTYHPNGAIAGFTYGNGIVHTLSQNLRGLPDTSSDVYGSTKFLVDGYDYDQNGNVLAISDGRPGQRSNRDFTYDGLDRLKTAKSIIFGNTGTVATASYAYDVLDNLTHVVVPATASGPARNHYYCYDAKWRLTNVKTGSCDGTSVIGLGYDVQGNLANKNGVTYAFDTGNRLRGTGGTLASSYLYDGHGRRIVDDTSDRKISQYTQTGQLALASDARTNTVTEYVYLQGSLVAERERNASTGVYTTKYQHTDALGSPVVVTGDTRTVLEKSEFEPYGRLANRAMTDGPGYTGHVSDAATGLSYMQQRYYDPMIGRFLSTDPVSAYAKPGINFNRYWYANNNPYRFTDPDGREVAGIYDPSNELLFMVDKDTRAWALAQGSSGGKPFGDPIPAGNYDILERAGRDGFYRLERRDGSYGNDESDGRTNLRLHGPGRTIGCVEVCTTDGFKQMRGLLENTSTSKAKVDSKSLGDRLRGRSENLTKFGLLGVLPSGYSLGFNHKTDSVVMRYAETGSHIVKERTICTVSKDGSCK